MTQMALPIWLSYLIALRRLAVVGLIFMLVAYYPLPATVTGDPDHDAFGIVLENLVLIFFGPLPQSGAVAVREAQVQSDRWWSRAMCCSFSPQPRCCWAGNGGS